MIMKRLYFYSIYYNKLECKSYDKPKSYMIHWLKKCESWNDIEVQFFLFDVFLNNI